MHTCIRTYKQTIRTDRQTDRRTYRHTYIHNIHTYIHTYITVHYITLHYITLHCSTLHYIALHCITLHYITYIIYIAYNKYITKIAFIHTNINTYTYKGTYIHVFDVLSLTPVPRPPVPLSPCPLSPGPLFPVPMSPLIINPKGVYPMQNSLVVQVYFPRMTSQVSQKVVLSEPWTVAVYLYIIMNTSTTTMQPISTRFLLCPKLTPAS